MSLGGGSENKIFKLFYSYIKEPAPPDASLPYRGLGASVRVSMTAMSTGALALA